MIKKILGFMIIISSATTQAADDAIIPWMNRSHSSQYAIAWTNKKFQNSSHSGECLTGFVEGWVYDQKPASNPMNGPSNIGYLKAKNGSTCTIVKASSNKVSVSCK
jgi:hypothetical protein